ncbi:MAG: acyl-CoA dehydrogenase family protein [Steroidobacteraceae bacterium]|jgi:alkylation response protein AidB-like acyl-CoA dehydrogenase|nr:acyl-CoA dehydrogenase family protein [Steroidobacteraceae bacterium]
MDFNLTDEQQMLRDGARRFFREHYGFEQRRAILAGGAGFSAECWSSYAELGWLALGQPEEVGGSSCSFIETAILMEEFGRALALEPYVSTAVLCARILERCDNAEARRSALGAMVEGKARFALAHYEPGGRYDARRLSVVAKRRGDDFLLNGWKSCVLDAPAADRLIVSARLEGEEAVALFLVEAAAAGLRMNAYPLIDGTRAADVGLEAVQAPSSCKLAEGAAVDELLQEALDRATLARVAMALGAMESVLPMTADYMKSRVQFGQPIGRFQALQHRLAEMFVEVQETRSILCCGLAHVDAQPAQRSAMVSAAKFVAANAARIVGAQAIQLHGGIAMTAECAAGHYYKHLLAFEKIHGDADWHLDRFTRHAVG